jgi:hypothetical protein
MKIKKFNENYNIDYEGDIGTEYAKFILSEYIDKELDGKSLQEIFIEIVESDELEESQEYIVIQELKEVCYDIYKQSQKLKTKIEYDSSKYNI